MNFARLGAAFTALIACITHFFINLLMGPPLARARTGDVAIPFRMGAGYAGDINRTHPFSVLPALMNSTNPARAYGEALLFDTTNGVRAIIAGDQHDSNAVTLAGLLVRPYPTQQTTGGMAASFGAATPPSSGVCDVLNEGFMMVQMKAGVTVKRGDPVWVWAVATETVNIQGQFQAASVSGKTVPIANARFMGPADANGIVEIQVRAE